MRSLWCGVICSKNSSTEVSLSHGEVLMALPYPCVGTAQKLRRRLYPRPIGLKTLEFIFSLMWSLHGMELANGEGHGRTNIPVGISQKASLEDMSP